MENDGFITGDPEETVETDPPKKRRGRPKKDATLNETPAEGDDKPKRKYAKRKKFDDESKSALARQIAGIHQMLAIMGGLPEMVLSDNECIMLADSVGTVAMEYNLSLSGKTGAMIQLLGTAAFIYLPRFSAINRRKRTTENNNAVATIDEVSNANTATVN